jgi:ABC-type amino acid transport substrate-binding protein
VALLGACAMTGALRWNRARMLRYAVITVALTAATIGGTRILFSRVIEQPYTKDKVLAGMHLLRQPVTAVVHREMPAWPTTEQGALLETIRARGVLRVGYLANSLPFAFFNGRDDLVGFDVELAHRLAAEMNVGLEFVPVDRRVLADQLDAGACDIVMSGVVVTPARASRTLYSHSYLDETLGLLVEDENRGRFETWNALREAGHLTIAIPDVPYYLDRIRDQMPDATIREFDDVAGLLSEGESEVDAIVFPAERGSAWTLIYPHYTVVVPGPTRIRLPLAYPLARGDQAFASFINTWIELKQKDGTMAALYEHWILGRSADRPTPRWSIMRDVLHWVD